MTRKGKRSWERYIHELIARDIDGTRTPTPALPAEPAPKAPRAPVVGAVVAPPVVADVAESCAPRDPWISADEILRDSGEEDFQGGIPVGAGATLSGSATLTAKSEWGVVAIRPEIRIYDVPHVVHALATLASLRELRPDPPVADQPTPTPAQSSAPTTRTVMPSVKGGDS
jgi:hypothetical protein